MARVSSTPPHLDYSPFYITPPLSFHPTSARDSLSHSARRIFPLVVTAVPSNLLTISQPQFNTGADNARGWGSFSAPLPGPQNID